eukprot:3355587-Rhodomonas_salina.1
MSGTDRAYDALSPTQCPGLPGTNIAFSSPLSAYGHVLRCPVLTGTDCCCSPDVTSGTDMR